MVCLQLSLYSYCTFRFTIAVLAPFAPVYLNAEVDVNGALFIDTCPLELHFLTFSLDCFLSI